MITFLGFLLLFVGVVLLVGSYVIPNQPREERDGYGGTRTVPPPAWAGVFNKKNGIMAMLIGLVMSVISGAFFYADPGTAYAVQYLWGGDKMISTQGLKTKWWGRTIPITYEISIKYVNVEKDSLGRPVEPLPEDEDGQYFRAAGRYEFADAIKADVALAIIGKVELDDEEKFLQMADRIKSEERLVNARIIPAIEAAVKNTCKLMDAQDYIVGEAAAFDRYLQDQLMHGPYILESYYEKEETEVIGDTATTRKIVVGGGNSGKTRKFRIKYGPDGEPLRNLQSETLSSYGIKITQAQVTSIDWEDSFDKRLDLQKQEVAQTQLEKQQAQREFYRAQKEKAKGEAEKAKERARLEKEQIQQTIVAQTEAKVAEFNLIKEKKQLEVEKYKAMSKKVAADAKYYENAKLVSAGLTPQERAEWNYKTAVGVAEQLKDLKLPETYIEGGGKSSKGNLLETLIGADLAKGMLKKPDSKK